MFLILISWRSYDDLWPGFFVVQTSYDDMNAQCDINSHITLKSSSASVCA